MGEKKNTLNQNIGDKFNQSRAPADTRSAPTSGAFGLKRRPRPPILNSGPPIPNSSP